MTEQQLIDSIKKSMGDDPHQILPDGSAPSDDSHSITIENTSGLVFWVDVYPGGYVIHLENKDGKHKSIDCGDSGRSSDWVDNG